MYLRLTTTLVSLLGLILISEKSEAANLTTTNVQGSGQNWTAAIWKTNSSGLATNSAAGVAPVAANTYETVFNGTGIGNGLNNTRIRNPATAGTQTFPGVSLTMYTNTELRAKQSGAVLNFPGVAGNPGLILAGALLDAGDDATFPITGSIQVQSQSYISHGANGGGGGISANRSFNISGFLSGTGNLVIMNSGLTLAQQISGTTNTYSGQWIVQCGWLQGVGTNSLGTNSITVDPNYSGYLTDMPSAASPAGPARFEVNYDLNSAGALTLVNAGKMRLHQNCAFTAVTIEGTPLSAGTHFYPELIANFPNNFEPGGSGAITVQPYGSLPTLGPIVIIQPSPQLIYLGHTAHFSVVAADNGAPPLTFHWKRYGTNLIDGGNISGSTTATLTVVNAAAADATDYSVVVGNNVGTATSINASLSFVSPSGEIYEAAVLANSPVAFYELNETGDPSTNSSPVYDFAGGYNGSYSNAVLNAFNGIAGPNPASGFPGFSVGNAAAQFANANVNSRVTVNPWRLNTNSVTITAWVNPSGPQNVSEGLAFCRGGTTVAGLCYSSVVDPLGNADIGYTWNNEFDTYSWVTGLVPPTGQWSMLALVVTPSNATIYMMNTNGLQSASRNYTHVVQAFNGTTTIGDDSAGTTGNRVFSGGIDDVGVFNYALSRAQLVSLFTNAAGALNLAPVIGLQPTNSSLYAGQTAVFAATGGGSDPLTYQWQSGATGSGVYTNVPNGGRISGADSQTLTIANINNNDSLDYVLTISNPYGAMTSSVANLVVQFTSPPENITLGAQQAAGFDWDNSASPNNWSDFLPASTSAVSKPGSTYEILAGARLRSPINPTVATFPGNMLTVDGDGVWNVNPAAGATIGEIRFKQPTYGLINGTVIFNKLVMNGGQLDNGADSGGGINTIIIGGEMDILKNAPMNNDNGADRGYRIDAWLTGSASIEIHAYNQPAFMPTYTNTFNVTGTSNTFSGKWNVVIGTLLGSGPNSLGTNDIIVGANGAFESGYDVNNPNGNLFLSGRMYLHQNDTFRSLFVNGAPLAVGTYSFAQLNAAYPSNFPATWPLKNGSTTTNGSGSITVLVQPAPTIVLQPVPVSVYPGQRAQFTVAAQGNAPLSYYWRKGTTFLTDNANVTGSSTTNLTIQSVTVGDGGGYSVVVSNSVGTVTSVVATLTILPTGPPLNLTLDYGGVPIQQPTGFDWNTPTNWSDGNPASLSAFSNPGSTYDVVVGSRLRPPVGTNYAIFPGNLLTVEGSGIFENGTVGGVGELRFKHPDPGTNVYRRLVLNGGQLDNGDDGTIVLQGEIDVGTNSAIYVDTAATVDRAIQIDAWLTGSGDLVWSQRAASFSGPDLNITGTSNTFSGRWNVLQGTLLGSGANSLGHNDITVSTTGALETLYDINNSNGNLMLNGNGQMFLHQNDTFKTVTVAGTQLSAGTYTFAQLNATYPTNFPPNWVQQAGSAFNSGSGSITVLTGPTLVTLGFQFNGSSLTLTWSQGILLEANDVTGPWTTNLSATPPSFNVTPTAPRKFYRIQVQ
jgi:hypothetical protein